jgi:hypothetical protein
MTNAQKVYDFLKAHKSQGFCDDCVQQNTNVDRHQVNTIASTLNLFPQEFSRVKQVCPQSCVIHEKFTTTAM